MIRDEYIERQIAEEESKARLRAAEDAGESLSAEKAPIQSRSPNILPMMEGCDTTRKTEPFLNRIQSLINEDEFGDMTIAEIIGVLEICKATQINRLFQE